MNLWNDKNLPRPPINTYKTVSKDIDIYQLSLAIYDGIVYYKNQALMEAEAGVLSRFIYRMKMKFRHDKSLKGMTKINKALLQYLNLNIVDVLTTFRGLIPEKYETVTYLPNRNILDYILLRLQGISKLMVRIIETTELSAHYMDNKILIGHFWKVAFMTYCLVARIRSLAKDLLVFTCKLYQQLLPFRCKLKNNGIDIVPEEYEFPNSLEKWLNVDNLLRSNYNIDLNNLSNKEFFNVMDEDDDYEDVNLNVSESSDFAKDDVEDEHADEGSNNDDVHDEVINEKPVASTCKSAQKTIKTSSVFADVEIGMVIERTAVRNNMVNELSDDIKSFINKINNVDQLNQFISKEDQIYCSKRSSSPFKSLDRIQWNMMKKIVYDAIKKCKKNKSKAKAYINEAKDALLICIN